MNGRSSAVPREAAVVVVGGGLSGLVAARDLVDAGIDVVLVEARDEIGGRTRRCVRANGRTIERGAEFTGPLQPTMLALAEEFGIAVEPMPMLADPEHVGAFVRVTGGERHVEPFPLAGDPEALEAYGVAAAELDALVRDLPAEAAWTDPRAHDLDRQTVGGWLDAHVTHPVARAALEFELAAAGPADEASLLATLAFLARHGGMEGFATALPSRFAGGSSAIALRLAEIVGARILLSAPARRIAQTDTGVTVETDRGSIAAQAVIVAVEPNLVEAIAFDPPLPADRAKAQARWIANPGAKFFAMYERPWWVDDGLCGFASGLEFVSLAADFSPLDRSEGQLAGMIFLQGANAAHWSQVLADPDRARAAALDDLATYFGPRARDEVTEFHLFDWHGDRWSRGAGGARLGPGVLSTYGHALRPPVGRVVWAGECNGTGDYMEGAASAGRAAASAAATLARSAT